ncbi:hypothetical protein EZI54_17540 [Marinobacter halodurans]|uniref:PilY1 beta-propeller domain-containing protein n=1 Tax=Marinobacter halodurans TaxID=2528979 RepID=A0ABY1ZGW3_9GAMM|nr:PilC/PilY family type IV pilus protein [Marinobacter halodurans]TBW50991.1 hypothetical protein EZI54_17540 [Marinobacter halodurans]
MRDKLKTFFGAMALVLPAAGAADPVVPSSQPLFLAGSVKHNLILGIDDSGSMDFELLMPANDGALWLNDEGTFVKSDGTFVDGTGDKYAYLFPNGSSSDYSNAAATQAGNQGAVPPIKAYAFARSAAYNKAYYDPNETYDPWPSYGGFSFSEYPGTAAPYDPNYTSDTLDLTSDFDTSKKTDSQWDFDINDDDMVCDNQGNTCSAGDKDYTYYPATYWVIDETSSYTFDPQKAGAEQQFNQGNSVLLEAENGVLNGDYVIGSKSAGADSGLLQSAGGNDYIVSPTGDANDSPSPASYGEVSLSFNVPVSGEYAIWIRKNTRDGNSDSMWVNLLGYGSSDITIAIDGNDFRTASDGAEWTKWWKGLKYDPGWTWDKWGTVTFNSTGTQTLRIRPREVPVPIDQIMVTSLDSTPTGAFSNLPGKETTSIVTRNCATDAEPSYYNAFRLYPDAFSGVDAIGPDGRCLKKYEIKSTVSDYPSGRSYKEELQNFSNWFTYYRRRHQSIRGGLGAAFQGISGIYAGMYWINNQRDVTMYDLDKAADLKTFLQDNYDHVSSGGTPLRDALDHARSQFKRTGDNAPIQYACQKNFTLLFTDGFAQSETISGIDNADGEAGEPYQDKYSSTLADIAYKMYVDNPRSDLKPLGAVRVPSSCDSANPPNTADCNTNLHINTYTVGLGAIGTLFNQTITKDSEKYSYKAVQNAYDHPPTWPDVSTIRDRRQIDDLYHAAVNGRGEIFNANTPALLASELSSALRDIIASLGSASGVTFNSATLESDSLIFSALFNSTAWSGDVEARALDPQSGDIAEDASWSAADVLDDTAPSSRTILTYSNDTGDGVPFRWDGSYDLLDSGQKADLQTSPTGVTDSLGEERLAYLRGTASTDFRNRDGRLGDIVHSTPLYVGAPRLSWPDADPFGTDAERYTSFRGDTNNVNRTPMVYVGANDGMLHGFKAVENESDGGGKELLAYVPRSIFSSDKKSGLHYLTDPDYRHKYYVDLSPQAVDVYMPGSDGGTPAWRTVLIGGLRGGGAGIFALDVTDPSTFSDANASSTVLWEFDASDGAPELNYQFDQPVVAMMNNGRWALLMGNGFADGSSVDDEKTGLFIIYMDGGLDGTWTRGSDSDYQFIEVGSTGGLGGVSVIDTNGDRVADRVYAGDLEGNMWTFDVSNSDSSKWGSAFSSGTGNNAEPAPLFTAANDFDGDGVIERQPIAMAPLVLRNNDSPVGSEGTNGEDYMVYFGTGKYFENGDPGDTSKQTMYGIWDRGVGSLKRDSLQEQTITTTASEDLREVSENSVDWAGNVKQQYGWYSDLPEEGERVLNTPKFRGEVLFYETYTPSQNACSSGGSNWFMSTSPDGSAPDSSVFDSNNDGTVDDDDGNYGGQRQDDSSTGSTGLLGNKQYYQKKNGQPGEREVDTGKDTNRAGRLGWHEITGS